MTLSYKVECLIADLSRQYPLWPSTFSTCECKRHMARGAGQCAVCIEEALGKIIDPKFASDLHAAIRHLAILKSDAIELACILENKDTK